SIPADDRNRVHPERHHGGKVERSDADTHAQGLPNRLAIDPLGDVLQSVAHEERGNAASKLDHLDATLHIAARFREGFAMLASVAADEFLDVLIQTQLELESNPVPL